MRFSDIALFYHADGVRQNGAKIKDREIAEAGFFDLSDLPNETTKATRRRLDELARHMPPDPYW